MALADKYHNDPEFLSVAMAVNEALNTVAQQFGCEAQLLFYTNTADIAVDKMTALILRAIKDKRAGA